MVLFECEIHRIQAVAELLAVMETGSTVSWGFELGGKHGQLISGNLACLSILFCLFSAERRLGEKTLILGLE